MKTGGGKEQSGQNDQRALPEKPWWHRAADAHGNSLTVLIRRVVTVL
jgi:hypothetical protein